MVAPNRQEFVNGNVVIVSLIPGRLEVSISIGTLGAAPIVGSVSIQPSLDGGLTEDDALSRILEIAAISVRGAMS